MTVPVGVVVVGGLFGVVGTPIVVTNLMSKAVVANSTLLLGNGDSCSGRDSVDSSYATAAEVKSKEGCLISCVSKFS